MSLRTLARRIAAGELATKRDGRNVLVEIPDDQLQRAAENLDPYPAREQPADESALKVSARPPDEAKASLDMLASMRRAFELANERADRADQRAARFGRNAAAFVVTTVALAIAAISIGAWMFHRHQLENSRQIAELKTEHVAELAVREASLQRLTKDVDTLSLSLEHWRGKADVNRRRLDAAIATQDRTAAERDGLLAETVRLRSIIAQLQSTEQMQGLMQDAWQALLGVHSTEYGGDANGDEPAMPQASEATPATPIVQGLRVRPVDPENN